MKLLKVMVLNWWDLTDEALPESDGLTIVEVTRKVTGWNFRKACFE